MTVHRGIARVQRNQKTFEIRKKRSVLFGKVDNLEGMDGEPRLAPFILDAGDRFNEWSRQRSADLAKSRRRFAKRMKWTD